MTKDEKREADIRFVGEHYTEMTDLDMGRERGISQSAVRRIRDNHGWKKGQQGIRASSPPEAEIPVDEQVRRDSELQRLRDDLRRTRRLYKFATKDTAHTEAIEQAIREIVPAHEPVPTPKPVKLNGEMETETAVLLYGDIHIGEVIDEEETGGIAVYDTEIAHRRMIYTIETAVKMTKEHLKGGYHIPNIHVFGLGDFVSGIIHKELEVTNEQGIVEQVMVAAEYLAESLLLLCQHFEQVTFTGVVGNHGRVEMNRYFKMKAKNNYDRMVYLIVEVMLRDQPNLTMDIPESFWTVVKVEDTRFLIMHGDNIKSWMGFPFYGLNRGYMKLRTLMEGYKAGFDTMIVGHFHTPNIFSVQRDEVIVNGSTKGGDEYALGQLSAATDPVQILFGVSKKYGRTWTFYINSSAVR